MGEVTLSMQASSFSIPLPRSQESAATTTWDESTVIVGEQHSQSADSIIETPPRRGGQSPLAVIQPAAPTALIERIPSVQELEMSGWFHPCVDVSPSLSLSHR